RHNKVNQQVQHFAEPEFGLIGQGRIFTERALADGAAEQGFVIQHKKPEQAGQRVQQPHVPVLKAVKPVTRLVRAHAEQAEGVYVFVHIIDVGEGVVVAVVLLRPVKAVAADQVETEGGQPVQAASAAERFVRGIVQHVRTKQGGSNAMGQ